MTSNVPGTGTNLPVRPFLDKARIGSLLVLAALLLLTVVLAWRTEDAMANRTATRAQPQSPAQNALIEPWQAAVDLGAMAVSAEEQQFARNAEDLADHEVHQAFQEALNQAELEVQKRSRQPESQRLTKIVTERQQVVAQDQATLKALTPPAGTAAATGDSINNDLDLANAQLQLDNDVLKDAQQKLALNLGDERAQLEQALNAHEAAVKKFEADATARSLSAVATSRHYGTLVRRLTAWFDQNSRIQALQQAAEQTESSITQVNKGTAAKSIAAIDDSASKSAKMDAMKKASAHNRIKMIASDRAQNLAVLAETYRKWAKQVGVQHRIVFHLLMQSLAYLSLVLLITLLLETLIRYVFNGTSFATSKFGQRLYSARLLSQLALYGIAALLIFVLLFGPPSELSTVLGLMTAGLTVVLQDFIISFCGWFVLMGKHGIRLGDWIEINGIGGEVADIGIFRTALLETGNWNDHGLPTGRRITFANSFAIRGQYFNFTTSGQWTWDELAITVPAADAYGTVEVIHKAVLEETEQESQLAEAEWKRGGRFNEVSHLNAEASVNMRPTSGGVDIIVRYVTRASSRYQLRNILYQRVLDVIYKPATQ